jgi:anti-sigma B factor antagonist/stage II sporulation protein AA (anti-sigma F factor antagonist)
MAVSCRQDGVTIVEMDESYNALEEEPIEALSDLLLAEVAKAPGRPLLVLDFSKTTYMGSRVLEVLFRTWKRLKERKGRMVLCSVQPFCSEVLQITHLDRIWEIQPDRAAAVRAVQGE